MSSEPAAARPATRLPVTLLLGDGVGPEVTRAAIRVLEASGAAIAWEECVAGEKAFAAGVSSGVPRETIESLARTRLALKGPLGTPVGYGGKSANVTLRKLFEAYGNLRPAREFPGVITPFSGRGIDLVVVRENVEDLYAGIEHMQTPEVAQCLKLITRPGCEKIARLAFEVARAEGRRSVHCATKANIMKLTEGMLQRVFHEVAADYPEIETHHVIIDNAAHQLVRRPEQFEVIVTTNMNGDILSDLTSGLVGGLGVAPSANIGQEVAIFEPVHGTAPDIAGMGLSNPTAAILSGVMLLRHVGQLQTAHSVESALLATLEQGKLTRDLGGGFGTEAFTDAVIENLGRRPRLAQVRAYRPLLVPGATQARPSPERRLVGVDIFVEADCAPAELGPRLEGIAEDTPFALEMISNRGSKVYPDVGAMPEWVDHHRCRFRLRNGSGGDEEILRLLAAVGGEFRWMHVEKLEQLDGEDAFSKAQGD